MIIPKIGRRAAVILGKAAGALIFAAVGGTVAWLLDRERRNILDEAERISEEPEQELELTLEAAEPSPETAEEEPPEAGDEA